MHILTPEEARFLVKRALQTIPAGTLQAMQRGPAEGRQKALELAVDVVLGHFGKARHQIARPERGPTRMPG